MICEKDILLFPVLAGCESVFLPETAGKIAWAAETAAQADLCYSKISCLKQAAGPFEPVVHHIIKWKCVNLTPEAAFTFLAAYMS